MSDVDQRLGSRYILKERLGRGAMGTVWRAVNTDTNQFVAVKVLSEGLSDEPEMIARFIQERNTLMAVKHPNLVRIHDMVVEDSRLAIVMDLVPGQDLHRHLVQRGGLGLAEVAVIGRGVADALTAIHAAGIIHRDLKPANILVDLSGPAPEPKLVDFGIARMLDGTRLTARSSVVGTPEYLSPEAISGGESTPAVDIYAFGIALYELFTGRTPFHGDQLLQVLNQHMYQEPPWPQSIPQQILPLLQAMLAKDPRNRPTAADISANMTALAAVAGPIPPLQPVQAPVPGQQPGSSPVPGQSPQPGFPLPSQPQPGSPLPGQSPQPGAQIPGHLNQPGSPLPGQLPPGSPQPGQLPPGSPQPGQSPIPGQFQPSSSPVPQQSPGQGWQNPPASPLPGAPGSPVPGAPGYPAPGFPGAPVHGAYPGSPATSPIPGPGTPLPQQPGYPQQQTPYPYPGAPAPSPLPGTPGLPSQTPLPPQTPVPAPSPSGFFYPQAGMFAPEGQGGEGSEGGSGALGGFNPSPPPFTDEMFSPKKSKGDRKKTLLIVGVVVVVLALAGGAFALFSGGGGSKTPQANGTGRATASAPSCPAQTGPAAAARWTLAGSAADCASTANALDLANGASFATQTPRGQVLNFAGGYASATVPLTGVVNTADSFTVSVWVYLDSYDKTQYATVLSFLGQNQAAYELQYNPGWKGWAFNRSSGDSLSADWIAAAATGMPQTQTWTHLVGQYDASAKTLSLYVNGKAVSTRTGITGWQAGGKLSVGANLNSGGAAYEGMTGDVSNLEIFNSALTANQIAALQ